MSDIKRDVRNPLLFECAWEMANKVGGIYAVIKTKVPVTISEYGDRYCLIGPLSYKTAPMDVEAQEPTDPHLASTLDNLRNAGVKFLYGRWLIEGAPHILLFDTGSQYSHLVFGYIVAWFLGEYVSRQLDKAVVVHFHEWQAGLAIPLCQCSVAHCADVFTPVSHTTAYESEHLRKLKPDGVLPNVVKFQAMHEFQNLHSTAKAKINDFVRGHFYGHYDFDLDNTLYMFTAGRYEYRRRVWTCSSSLWPD
ncbi:Glycogen [starch] synthase [Grifola frondosa]|uniref:Glycogen [starch] synthase n=1 Tax=Grifola frondosa TaxID=5627 RepID=A0A1C7LN56_GRIFR|nr:Glycogen [starch] synthase [Grifola frondosa]